MEKNFLYPISNKILLVKHKKNGEERKKYPAIHGLQCLVRISL
jgi:hypothetical protein